VTETCESCGKPGYVVLVDGSIWCLGCDSAARNMGYDDTPIEYECECQEYRPPHPKAVYSDGTTADAAGRMGRLVRLVEEGRFA
jgi:hypothetical protein